MVADLQRRYRIEQASSALNWFISIMKWLWITAATFMLGLSGAAFAQSQPIERQYKGKPGEAINVGVFASLKLDCTAGPLPVVRLTQSPTHGRVTVKQGRLRATNFKQCLATEIPAFVAIYRSAPDFIGQDLLTLEIIGKNGKAQIQKITVTVMRPGADRGI
jgi:hypothetical protein